LCLIFFFLFFLVAEEYSVQSKAIQIGLLYGGRNTQFGMS